MNIGWYVCRSCRPAQPFFHRSPLHHTLLRKKIDRSHCRHPPHCCCLRLHSATASGSDCPADPSHLAVSARRGCPMSYAAEDAPRQSAHSTSPLASYPLKHHPMMHLRLASTPAPTASARHCNALIFEKNRIL
jgi:hypothetical protein